MPRHHDGALLDRIYEYLTHAPSWVGPVLAFFIGVLFQFVVPPLIPPKMGTIETGQLGAQISHALALYLPPAVLVLWVIAELKKWGHRRTFDRQTGLASIRELSWQDFEYFVAEAYRRRGYRAETIGTYGNDGGIDIVLTGHGETVLVQCKQWKSWSVGEKVVRELCGVIADRKATRGIIVTSGRFKRNAVAFAQRNAVELVDGSKLEQLIKQVQTHPAPTSKHQPSQPSSLPACPVCGSPMVQRTAKRGPQTGQDFYGCSRYPACRGIRQITDTHLSV